jgi:ABC-2 type transport system ATP-binding protein
VIDPGDSAVRTSALVKAYGQKTVLSDIDLEIPAGERCCIVGANGSGKTTLLEIIMALKLPTSGDVEVLGRKPSDPKLKMQRVMLMERAAYPYYAKVREVVWMYSGFYPGRVDIDRLLKGYELDGNIFIRHLSKGQRQRLGILITLLGDPPLVILDEPTSGLDPQARVKFWELLGERLGRASNTLIFATHDLTEAERWATRVAVMHRGRLIAVRSPEELCRSVIGTRRKLTIIGSPGADTSRWQTEDVGLVARLGAETALYTDHPEKVLNHINLAGDRYQVRIENVSVRDAFFKLTGETPDEQSSFAMQKSG